MSNVSQETQSPQFTSLELLAELISQATGVSIERIKSQQRGKKVCEARKMLSELADYCGFTQSEIGRFMNKDHTTIGYHLRKASGAT
jgi:chromosomal replication initiation ATPase DnaA